VQLNKRHNDLENTNKLDFTTSSNTPENIDKQCSDLMIEIHGLLDLKNTPIKNAVKVLGVTPSQARKLAKGNIHNFSVFELQTFLDRLNNTKP
jgi:predicted XRE-type DNA-binding protein